MPFLTEELWQKVPRPNNGPHCIALADFPKASAGPRDLQAERDMEALQAVISAARTIRSEHEVHPSAEVPLVLRSADPSREALYRSQLGAIRALAKTSGEPAIEAAGGPRPRGSVLGFVAETEVLVGLRGLVEPSKETDRIEREIKKAEKDIAATEKKLGLPSFTEKAPPEVVAEAKSSLEALRRKRAQLEDAKGIAAELA